MEGNADGFVFDVVEAAAFEFEPLVGGGATGAAKRVFHWLAEGAGGVGGGVLEDFGEGSAGDDFAAATAGAGAEVDDAVGAAHGFLVVLNDNK